ncbi:MAG: hypothetical protein AMXMBFR84_33310 [Candidatus Hydrogenedentota bacterium]
MSKIVHAVIHFMDQTSVNLAWPLQGGEDPHARVSKVRKALEMDRIAIEVQGDLFVIPITNIKYVQITPAPANLPGDVVRGGHMA